MRKELRLSGSGGQGVITAAIIFAEAAVREGKEAVQSQSYGPEARGGASKSEVIIDDAPIYHPHGYEGSRNRGNFFKGPGGFKGGGKGQGKALLQDFGAQRRQDCYLPVQALEADAMAQHSGKNAGQEGGCSTGGRGEAAEGITVQGTDDADAQPNIGAADDAAHGP